jgi:glycogen synthase
MKIWLLSSEFPHPQAGGIARYVDHMARALVEAGAEVLVIGPTRESLEKPLAEGGAPLPDRPQVSPEPPYRVHLFHANYHQLNGIDTTREPEEDPAFPFNVLNKDLALSFQIAEEVQRLAASEGLPDVIECQEYKALGAFIQLRRLTDQNYLPGVPLVVFLHTPDFLVEELNQEPRFKVPRYWVGRQERAVLFGADALVAPSKLIAETLRTKLATPELEIAVIPLPHAPVQAVPEPAPTTPAVPTGSSGRLLFVGRLEPRKGVLQLLRACERLWRRGLKFEMRLVGSSVYFHPKRCPLDVFIQRKYASWIESGHLVLTGALDTRAIQEELAHATAMVLPSLWENFPNVCMEAMLAGRPVIASCSGGHAELIGTDGQCGQLFDPLDEENFMAALQKALRWSPEERQGIGRAARQRVQEFCHPQKIARARLAHFQQVIQNYRAPALYPFPEPARRCGQVNQSLPGVAAEDTSVTIVIPFYNLGAFVEEAVDSALASKGCDFDVLLVDDGSTDEESLEVLEKLRQRGDPRLRIVHKENEGLARARNFGAQQARGAYVCFLDADDALQPEFLPRAVALFKRYQNVHIVASWARFFGAKRGLWVSWNLEFPYLLAHNLIIPICMVRKDAFLAFGTNKKSMTYGLEDYEGWIGMLAAGCGALAIPEPLTRYRVREASMFQVINGDQFLYLYDIIVREHPELYRRYGPELFHLLNANGPCHLWAEPTAWVAPIDNLEAFAAQGLVAERKKTELWWRKTVELQEELSAAHKETENQWREGCRLRERLAQLDTHARKQAARLRELEEKT